MKYDELKVGKTYYHRMLKDPTFYVVVSRQSNDVFNVIQVTKPGLRGLVHVYLNDTLERREDDMLDRLEKANVKRLRAYIKLMFEGIVTVH